MGSLVQLSMVNNAGYGFLRLWLVGGLPMALLHVLGK